jgi:hypothetical protein
MRTIKVTTLSDKRSIYINIDMIGHLYEIEEKDFNREPKKYTVIETTTHNNGGFKVIESIQEVFNRIKAEE